MPSIKHHALPDIVISHRKNIIKKLGVKSVVGMVKMWWGREN